MSFISHCQQLLKSKRLSSVRNRQRQLGFQTLEVRRVFATIDLATLSAAQGSVIQHGAEQVSAIGDFNGDGYDDFYLSLASRQQEILDTNPLGDGWVVFGKPVPPGTIDLNQIGSQGIHLTTNLNRFVLDSARPAGDINGDGFADLIVSSHRQYSFGNDGRIDHDFRTNIIFGESSPPSQIDFAATNSTDFISIVPPTEIYAGLSSIWEVDHSSTGGVGDVNGDGYDDFFLAYPAARVNYLVYGRSSFLGGIDLPNLTQSQGVRLPTSFATKYYGESISAAGDVNHDGFADFLIRSTLVFGGPALPATIILDSLGTAGVRISGADPDDFLGWNAVSNAGDFNGDGFDDIILGAWMANSVGDARTSAGESYIILGRSDFTTSIDLASFNDRVIRIYGAVSGDHSGYSVSNAGDVNADGLDDVIIGAPGELDLNGFDAGRSYVVYGSKVLSPSIDLAALGSTVGLTILGTADSASGKSVAGVGDVNGDGFTDLLVAAPSGATYVDDVVPDRTSYLIYGGANFAAADFPKGTPASESLTGTLAADRIVAGRGNDTVISSGGADVFYGGQGNDQFKMKDTAFFRVDGGSGNDVLQLLGANLTLKLSDNKVKSVETIDITGVGNNLLIVKPTDFDVVSPKTHTLTVKGNAGDRINYGSGWKQAANATIGGITYYTLVKDNLTLRVQQGITINLAPVISGFAGQISVSQNGPAKLIDTDATVTDDSVNFAAGTLVASVSQNAESLDRITILPAGTGVGQISTSGANVKYGSQIIGSFSGTNVLTVALNGNATPAAVQSLLRRLAFNTTSNSTLDRQIQVSITQGGITSNAPIKTAHVAANNVAPTLSGLSQQTYDIGTSYLIKIAPSATLTDPDTTKFGGAVLTVAIANPTLEETLFIPQTPNRSFVPLGGYINNKITYNGTEVGKWSGGSGGAPIVLSFNDKATLAAVQNAIQSISFKTNSNTYTGVRPMSVSFSDGDGGNSAVYPLSITVVRTITPHILNVFASRNYNYHSGGPSLAIFAGGSANVTSVASLTGAQLRVETTSNGLASDLYNVTGTYYSIQGNKLFHDSTEIGTWSGGVGTTPLVITFNASITLLTIQDLVRSIKFKLPLDSEPSVTTRSFRITFTVEGNSSVPQNTTITFNRVG